MLGIWHEESHYENVANPHTKPHLNFVVFRIIFLLLILVFLVINTRYSYFSLALVADSFFTNWFYF